MKNLRYVAVSIISVLVIFTIYTNMTVVKTKGKTSNVANSFWKEAKSKKYAPEFCSWVNLKTTSTPVMAKKNFVNFFAFLCCVIVCNVV